jgi:phenylalanyl-tRNA synthetase beta chain
MKCSVSWINELAGTNFSAKEMAELFTRHSFEVDGIETIAGAPDGVIVGKILDVASHPNADRLSVVRVAIDPEEQAILSIVCGANNIASGDRVPVATVGTNLGEDFVIKRSNIRGVESEGMLCAEDELGLGGDHSGIMHLDAETPIGTPLLKLFPQEESIELDILASRGRDALSHKGIAREVRAMERLHKTHNSKRREISNVDNGFSLDVSHSADIAVSVKDEKLCKRYIGALLANVNNRAETPLWMKNRLRICGIRSVNIATDITNYVMLETGQPMHAFDANRIENSKSGNLSVCVRNAEEGETLTLLDGSEIVLHRDDMVIANEEKPLALAGVMGGVDSGTNEQTTRVLLEAAWFDPVSIRKTRIRHKLTTESAYRFERNVDPEGALLAIQRAEELFRTLAGAEVVAMRDAYFEPEATREVSVDAAYIRQLLGADISTETMVAILRALEFLVEEEGEMLSVSVPTFRKDISDGADIAEEIGRLYGYERIAPQPMCAEVRSAQMSLSRVFARRLREVLLGAGYDETMSYSFYGEEAVASFGLDASRHFHIFNPMNPSQRLFRTTLVPNILASVRENARRSDAVRVFEIGNTYVRGEDGSVIENRRLAMAMCFKDKRESIGERLREAKGVAELAVRELTGSTLLFAEVSEDHLPIWLHPTRVAAMMLDGKTLGMIGVLHPKLAKSAKFPETTIVAEWTLPPFEKAFSEMRTTYRSIPRFPDGLRDISFELPKGVSAGSVDLVIRTFGGKYIRSAELFDAYEEGDKRSVAYRLAFGANDRTLSGEEVEAFANEMIAIVEKETRARVKREA